MKHPNAIEFIKENKLKNDYKLVAEKCDCSPHTVRATIKKAPVSDLEIKIFKKFTSILLARQTKQQKALQHAS